MEDLHYLLTFNHCKKKKCSVLFGDLKNESKFQLQKKLEQAIVEAPSTLKDFIEIEEDKQLMSKVDPENEKYVYKILEHLDPSVRS